MIEQNTLGERESTYFLGNRVAGKLPYFPLSLLFNECAFVVGERARYLGLDAHSHQ